MDNRLILIIPLVTLSWISVGTYAQSQDIAVEVPNGVTSAPDEIVETNVTSAPDEISNVTSAPDDIVETNVTSAPDEIVETNVTSAPDEIVETNMTSAPDEIVETNKTSAPDEISNVTSAPDDIEETNETSAPDEISNVTSAPDDIEETNETSAPDEISNVTSAPDEIVETNVTSAPDEIVETNGTSAPDEIVETNVTSAPDEIVETNVTSAPDEIVETNGTSAPDEIVETNGTSAPDEIVETNGTSAPDEIVETNGTSAPDEIVKTNMTTVAPNTVTSAPNTPMETNMTAAPTSTALVTPYIIPVGYLQTPLSRAECGIQQLCVSAPAVCDPSSDTTCYFVGVKWQSGQNFEFALSGQSAGYTANSPDGTLGGNNSTYVCANDGGVVRFFTTVLSNIQLIEKKLNVSSVMGRVDGTRIQCTFVATLPTTATKSATVYTLAVLTGSFNRYSRNLGTPVVQLLSPLRDLGNSYVTNQTITSGMTTIHAITLQQSLTQDLLIIVGVLGLAIL